MLNKILKIKALLLLSFIGIFVVLIVSFVVVIAGSSSMYDVKYKESANIAGSSGVKNNFLYVDKYYQLLNNHLLKEGYVSLERLVFYLQRTNNILDVSTLPFEKWNDAYVKNINPEAKQMIPIDNICKNINSDSPLSDFTVKSGKNTNGVAIDVIDLCSNTSKDSSYKYLPYKFPLKSNFYVTSIVFENRNVELNYNYASKNYHNGWDFGVPIGTEFYSICSGNINQIVTTQFNDLPFNQSGNTTGNYIRVKCDNGLIASYLHIKANSIPNKYRIGTPVKAGDLLGKTSTTGLSTGPHLHLGLTKEDGTVLDALDYISFK